jgi:hypothetical protein
VNHEDIHDQQHIVERLVLAARGRLEDKLHELGRRLEETKEALDLARMIRERPLAFIAGALAAGVAIGLASDRPRGKLTTALEAMVTGLAVSTARSWLTARFATLVPGLLDPPPAAGRSASEVGH